MRQAIADLFDRALAADDIPGAVVGVTGPAATTYLTAFGRRSAAAEAPMAADAIMGIASFSKAITTAAALTFVEEGRLALDEPVGRWLPELANPSILEGFAEDGAPRLRPARTPITLRHLLAHTSGLGYDMWSEDLVRYRKALDIPSFTSGRKRAFELPLLFEPGTQFRYGLGIDWAGFLIERLSGRSLEEVIRTRIAAPLGLADTTFDPGPDRWPRVAAMHTRNSDGGFKAMEPAPPGKPEVLSGGGALYGTAADYLAFLRALLNRGGGVLKPETVALMRENQIAGVPAAPFKSAIPRATHDVDLLPGIRTGWGLSFLLNLDPVPAGRSAGSVGWAGLPNCYYWVDFERSRAGVLMMQLLPFFDARAYRLFRSFEEIVSSAAELAA